MLWPKGAKALLWLPFDFLWIMPKKEKEEEKKKKEAKGKSPFPDAFYLAPL